MTSDACRSACVRLLATMVWLTLGVLMPEGAWAQDTLVNPPPIYSAVDPQNVDLGSGAFTLTTSEVTIGQPGAGGLSYGRIYINGGWRDSFIGGINKNGNTYTVSIGGASEAFTSSDGVNFTNAGGGGSILSVNGTLYNYTMADGTVATFDKNYCCIINNYNNGYFSSSEGRIISLQRPSGEFLRWSYQFQQFCGSQASGDPCFIFGRIQSVYNNFGYQIRYVYAASNTGSMDKYVDWLTLTGVIGFNMGVDACAATSQACTLGANWPSVTYAKAADNANARTTTDNMGRVTRYTFGGSGLTAIRRPSSGTDNITIGYDSSGRVSSVNNGAGTWSYSYSDSGNVRTTTVTDPLNHQRIVTTDLTTGQMLTERDALGNTTTYSYDGSHRLSQVTQPEGNYVTYEYDRRGNVKKMTKYGKPGSGMVAWSEATFEDNGNYADGCSNRKTCNKSTASHDDNGHWTYYEYDPDHGGVKKVTGESPGNGQPQPQTRYSYGQFHASYKNGSGAWVSGDTVYLPTGTSTCVTGNWNGSACDTGAAKEARTSITYSTATNQLNNLLPATMTQDAGDGSAAATTTMTWDTVGNKLTVVGPANTGTTYYYYDAARQVVGVVGPSAGESGLYRAVAVSYNADGQATETRQGTVSQQSDSPWDRTFVTLQKTGVLYDGQGRKTWDVIKDPSNNELLTTAYGYDGANHLLYAVRPMWDTGTDRGTNYTYDAAGRVTQVDVNGQTIATSTYTANGLKHTVADGNGNTTTYDYDGFLRMSKVTYPSVNGTAPYETFGYNNDSNLTSHQLRGQQTTIGFNRDALERVISRDVGGYGYSYDNLGHVTQVTATGRPTVTMSYDARGRLTSQGTGDRTVSADYDAAGRLKTLTWPDGTHADYTYDATGAMLSISVNGTWVQGYTYDDWGRRKSTTRANGVTTSYNFDSISRLASLKFGGGVGLNLTFSYNQAGQILTRTSDKVAYDPPAPLNGTTTYTNNALNQTTQVSGATGTALSYDDRGNLAGYGSTSLVYDVDNELTSMSGVSGATLSYDPLGRLYQLTQGSTTTRFLYFGDRLVAEYDASGTVLRRYIPGAATDETAVWYEGAGTGSAGWLIPDERGSVVAVTDGGGTVQATNTYDEYGLPGAGNRGRFQYTGQVYLAEIGAYYYKARIYIPSLGKFAQADPAGYSAGMNMYAYVGGDPVNNTDPTGLSCAGIGGYGTDGIYTIPVSPFCSGPITGSVAGSEIVLNPYSARNRPAIIFVKTGGSEPQSDPNAHKYVINRKAACSADTAFSKFLPPGMSAPAAPAAQEGLTPRIMLAGLPGTPPNPISQYVNSSTRTIINTTLPGHMFYPGTVTIQVNPLSSGSGADITITGEGNGPNPELNDAVGIGFFGTLASTVAQMCDESAGVQSWSPASM